MVNPKDASKIELDLSIGAFESKNQFILAHPFGMSLKKFNKQPSDQEWDQLCIQAKKNNIVLELNSKYHSNLNYVLNKYIQHNVLMTIGSDAHSFQEIGECWELLHTENKFIHAT